MYPFTWVHRGYQKYKKHRNLHCPATININIVHGYSKYRLSKEAIDMIDLFMAEKAIKTNPCVSDNKKDKLKVSGFNN